MKSKYQPAIAENRNGGIESYNIFIENGRRWDLWRGGVLRMRAALRRLLRAHQLPAAGVTRCLHAYCAGIRSDRASSPAAAAPLCRQLRAAPGATPRICILGSTRISGYLRSLNMVVAKARRRRHRMRATWRRLVARRRRRFLITARRCSRLISAVVVVSSYNAVWR